MKLYLLKVKACQEAGTTWNQTALVDGMGLSHFSKHLVPDLRNQEIDDAFVTKLYDGILRWREPNRPRLLGERVFPGEPRKVTHSAADYAAMQRRAENGLAEIVPPGYSRVFAEDGGRSYGKTLRAMALRSVPADSRREAFGNALKDIRAHEQLQEAYNIKRICRRWRVPVFPAALIPPAREELTEKDIDELYDNAAALWSVRNVRKRLFRNGSEPVTLFTDEEVRAAAQLVPPDSPAPTRPRSCWLCRLWKRFTGWLCRLFHLNK